jgi:hypothetical protein
LPTDFEFSVPGGITGKLVLSQRMDTKKLKVCEPFMFQVWSWKKVRYEKWAVHLLANGKILFPLSAPFEPTPPPCVPG